MMVGVPRRRQRWPYALAAAVVAFAIITAVAFAEYQGSDMLGNISPESATGGGFADKYPLSNYALDYHVDGPSLTGGVGDPGPMFSQWLTSQTWDVVRFFNRLAIDGFAWAHSLDLMNGPQGAMRPINQAIQNLHENVLGTWWFMVALALAGMWATWKGLVQRRYPELAVGLGTALLFVMIAFLFLYQPQQTIGQISKWTNGMSTAFLAGVNGSSDAREAKRDVADQLFNAMIYEPWAVLQFGGLKVCTSPTLKNENGWPMPLRESDPRPKRCRPVLERGRDGHGNYAARFVRHPDTSKARDKEYEALKDGEAPNDTQFAGYPIDKADSPAVDPMQAGGAGQRLTAVVLIAMGSLMFILLIGALSLWIILAQIIALLLVAFTPVMVLLGLFPPTHAYFGMWLKKLGTVLVVKAVYSLVLAVVITTTMALGGAAGSMGFLAAYGLTTAFFGLIFFNRKKLAGLPVQATGFVEKRHYRKAGHAMDSAAGAVLYPGKAMYGAATNWKQNRGEQESATRHRSTGEQTSATTERTNEHTTEHTNSTTERGRFTYAETSESGSRPTQGSPNGSTPAPRSDIQDSGSDFHASAGTNGHNGHSEGNVRTVKQDIERARATSSVAPPAPQEHSGQPDRLPEPPREFSTALKQERAERAASHLPD
jgi:hypothetical protein